MRILLRTSFLLLLVTFANAQRFNHPELEWKTIEGENFIVHYHQNVEWTANEALHVAEDIYPYITELYEYEPEEKTHLIIKDTDDYANGSAYYFDNKMEIWAKPLDYELRGSHYWLRDVITHEFTHIVSLRASRKFRGNIPAGYFQIIAYEPERREDVLYGYPNGIVSYPIPSVSVPMWWAEGIAQYQSNEARWDWWDSFRDMILRDRIKYDKVLTINEMDGFGKTGIGNESVYDHGFSFVDFLTRNFGEDILELVSYEMTKITNYSFYEVLEKLTHFPADILWMKWKKELDEGHAELFRPGEAISPIRFVQREGDANYHPRINPADGSIGFISSAGETYLSRTALFIEDTTESFTKLLPGAEGFDWSPDGRHIVYARKEYHDGGIPDPVKSGVRNHFHSFLTADFHAQECDLCKIRISGSRYSDLFIVPRDSLKGEEQLTFGERVTNPSWSPDGSMIAYVNLRDGTNNLCLAFPDHPDSVVQLTDFAPGTQVYVPNWSPDSRSIVFDYTSGSNRDIALYDLESNTLLELMNDVWDERNPSFRSDYEILYSDDRTGIFNIYTFDLITDEEYRLTNVHGGAFQPEWYGDNLYYSLYDSLGFNIAVLESAELIRKKTQAVDQSVERIIEPTWERHEEPLEPIKYTMQYGPMFILPRLQVEIDNRTNTVVQKPGFYFFSDEILSNYSMIGGLGIAGNKDLDLFLSARYHGFLPTLSFEFYQMVRHTEEELWYYDKVWPADAEVTFGLTQGIFAADILIPPRHAVKFDISASNYRSTIAAHQIPGVATGRVGEDYFTGWDWGLKWDAADIHVRQERNINPSGYKTSVSFRANRHTFLDEKYRYVNFDISGFYGYRLPTPRKIIVSNITEFNYVDNNGVDDFFYQFAGGMPGLRGYPYYSIKGTRRFVSTITARMPVFQDLYRRTAHLMVRDMYVGVHTQFGGAWTKTEKLKLLSDIGFDMRFALNSYYAFPTAVELGAYYGLNDHTVLTDDNDLLEYGGEWRFYWKVLFGFE